MPSGQPGAEPRGAASSRVSGIPAVPGNDHYSVRAGPTPHERPVTGPMVVVARTGHSALMMSSTRSLASPKSIAVLSRKKSGFCTPA